jgi:hypothetical protein
MKQGHEITEGIVLGALGIAVITGSLKLDNFGPLALSPGLFPFILGVCLVALVLVLILRNIRRPAKEETDKAPLPGESSNMVKARWIKITAITALSLVYILLLSIAGFIISSAVYVLALMLLLGERKWWKLIITPVMVSLLIFTLFAKGLKVYLP